MSLSLCTHKVGNILREKMLLKLVASLPTMAVIFLFELFTSPFIYY